MDGHARIRQMVQLSMHRTSILVADDYGMMTVTSLHQVLLGSSSSNDSTDGNTPVRFWPDVLWPQRLPSLQLRSPTIRIAPDMKSCMQIAAAWTVYPKRSFYIVYLNSSSEILTDCDPTSLQLTVAYMPTRSGTLRVKCCAFEWPGLVRNVSRCRSSCNSYG